MSHATNDTIKANSQIDKLSVEPKPPSSNMMPKQNDVESCLSMVSSSGIGSSVNTNSTDLATNCRQMSLTLGQPVSSKNAKIIFDIKTTTNTQHKTNEILNEEVGDQQQQQTCQIVCNNTEETIVEDAQRQTSISKRKNSRAQPLNSRIRSAFEIIRTTFYSNSTRSSDTQKQKKSKKSSKQNETTAKANKDVNITSKPVNESTKREANGSEAFATCHLCCNECNKVNQKDGHNFMYYLDTCDHSFCIDCLRQYLKFQIIESRVAISCPQCNEKMHPNDIYELLSITNELSSNTFPKPANQIQFSPLPQLPIQSQLSSTESQSSPRSTKSLFDSTTNFTKQEQEVCKTTKVKNDSISSTSSSSSSSKPQNNNKTSKKEQNWPQLIQKYEEFMLRRVLVTIPDTRWCPAPDCNYAVIANGCANCPQLYCMRPNCGTSFCYHCKQFWHPNETCDEAAIRNNQSTINGAFVANKNDLFYDVINSAGNANGASSSTNKLIRSLLQRSNSHISITSTNNPGLINNNGLTNTTTILTSRSITGDLIKEEIKKCPRCMALIVKMDDGSCNHITCSVCGCEFCWLCMKEISDLHYLSPSGCTFWGKKPWSRKKKLLWQLGTLIGAPIGIALIAGVAVPSILIGLPIWLGRKVYVRYKTIGRHKRNLIVVGAVFGSILVAPLVAALAVGIGVPILLAYVYGVVPISLCRSGGCGVTTNTNGGVRFAFDDETTENNNYFNFTQIQNTNTQASTSGKGNASGSKKHSKHSEKSKTKTSTYEQITKTNSVTIPISAAGIEPSLTDNIVVAKLTNDEETINGKKKNAYATLTNVTGSSAQNNPTLLANAQTPVLVTITMANKASRNSKKDEENAASVVFANPNKKKKSSSTKPSSSSRSKRSSSRHNKRLSANISSANSVSVACGSVEIGNTLKAGSSSVRSKSKQANKNSDFKENKSDIKLSISNETGTAINTIRRFNILHNKNKDDSQTILTKNADFDENDLSTSSYNSQLILENNEERKNTKAIVRVYSANANKQDQSNKKVISSKILNNPSIGEISIGAYTTSFSASGSNLCNYYLDENKNKNEREKVNSDESCDESDSDDSQEEDEDEDDDDDDDTENFSGKYLQKNNFQRNTSSGKVTSADNSNRDSASNIAIASASIKQSIDYSFTSKTDEASVKALSGVVKVIDASKFSKLRASTKNSEETDVKSIDTVNNYEKVVSLNTNDNDTYSVSLMSQKSINPSVMALAGSVKDNQSISNFSN